MLLHILPNTAGAMSHRALCALCFGERGVLAADHMRAGGDWGAHGWGSSIIYSLDLQNIIVEGRKVRGTATVCTSIEVGKPGGCILRFDLPHWLGFTVKPFFASSVMLACVACASTQVNENTLDIASTYDQLITRQVTFNLRKTFNDPFGIPAFVRVSVQSATTMNSINPTFTFPLSSQISSMTQQAFAPAGLTTTLSRNGQRVGEGLSVSASDQWNQSYTLTPVTDPDQLRRLRLLFQYATRNLEGLDYNDPSALAAANDLFEISFPIIEAAPSGGGGSSNTLTVTINGKSVAVNQTSAPSASSKKQYVRRAFAVDQQNNVVGTTWIKVSPDLTFIAQPGCIMCDYNHRLNSEDVRFTKDKDIKDHYADFTKLEKNYDLTETWLARPGEQAATGLIRLPSGIGTALHARDEGSGLKYYFEFALFCVEAASQGTGSPTSGGQSEGRKTTPPPFTIAIPVGGAP